MAEEPRRDIDELSVSELRTRASELEITGRSSMNKDELRQSVADAEEQTGPATTSGDPSSTSDEGGADESASSGEPLAAGEETPASDIAAPSIGPHTELDQFKESPEERLAKHEQSDVDAMGLDKRRGVTGQQYGASFAKQATIYGVFLVVLVALVIGGKLAADELDQGPEVNPDKAPWSQPDAQQRAPTAIDFPRNPSP